MASAQIINLDNWDIDQTLFIEKTNSTIPMPTPTESTPVQRSYAGALLKSPEGAAAAGAIKRTRKQQTYVLYKITPANIKTDDLQFADNLQII